MSFASKITQACHHELTKDKFDKIPVGDSEIDIPFHVKHSGTRGTSRWQGLYLNKRFTSIIELEDTRIYGRNLHGGKLQ